MGDQLVCNFLGVRCALRISTITCSSQFFLSSTQKMYYEPVDFCNNKSNSTVYLVSLDELVFKILNFVQTKGTAALTHMLADVDMRMTL